MRPRPSFRTVSFWVRMPAVTPHWSLPSSRIRLSSTATGFWFTCATGRIRKPDSDSA